MNTRTSRAPAARRRPFRRLAGRLERLWDTVVEWCDRALLGGFRHVRGKAARHWVRCLADVALVLRYARGFEARLVIGPAGQVVLVAPPTSAEFLSRSLMPDAHRQVPLGRIPLWKLRRKTRQWLAGEVDLVVAEVSRLTPADRRLRATFRVPTWVNQELAIPEPVEALIAGTPKRGLRGSVNKAGRGGFAYTHTRDPQLFERFYREMYLPTARVRHESLAVVAPHAKQRWWFDRHGLLLVTRNGEPVGGGLTHMDGDCCIGVEGGMRDGDPAVYRAGGNAYLLWANLLWAREHGATRFNMGGSRPLRSDGSFTYKRKWGAAVVRRQRPYGHWLFQSQAMGAPLRRRMNALGLIAERGDHFYAVWLAGDDDDDDGGRPACEDDARDDGLAGLLVVRPATRHGPAPADRSAPRCGHTGAHSPAAGAVPVDAVPRSVALSLPESSGM